jgi:F0F1-type ATP synthase membrane subunit b/b'
MDQGFTEREESVAKVADKARRKVAKAKQSADKEVERAAKKVAKEEERETKKRQKEFEKRRSQFVTGISKNLGAAVNTYLAGGTLTFREHGRDLASTVFKGLGVV